MAEGVHSATLHIRTMAYTREPMLDEYFPEADYIEQIRLLADLCDTLIPGIAEGSVESLSWTVRTRPVQARWLADILRPEGYDLDDLLNA